MNPSAALIQWRNSGDRFEFRGHTIFVRQHQPSGNKPNLVLIHGYPTASWDWHLIWPALAENFRLIAPDLMGFGFSDKPRGHCYTLVEQADLIEALCAANGIHHAHVLAHDYGVSVAQELLARHRDGGPVQLESVTFLNGGLFPETHRPRLIQTLLAGPLGALIDTVMGRRQFDRSFSSVFGAGTQPSSEELADFWYLIEHDGGRRVLHLLQRYLSERKLHRERWLRAMQRSTVPLKLINGNVDPVSGAHMVQRYRELIPAANVTDLPDIGHYPHVEAPDAVLGAFNAFMKSLMG